MRLFPDFDDNLRQAFRRETELLFESVMREDRSVLDLLRADYTFVNERLAKHYGIPNVYGSRFRSRGPFDARRSAERGGLLRQGSILTVTSYATRTSPVIRGKWILDNMLGMPAAAAAGRRAGARRGEDGRSGMRRSANGWRSTARTRPARAATADGSGRFRAGELRRGRPLADARGGRADRCVGHAVRRHASSAGSPGCEKAILKRPELFVTR